MQIANQDMAPNQNRKNQLSSNTEANSGAIPWPDLPQQLTTLVGKQLQLLNNISWGGVGKSWRTVPRQCSSSAKAPWLELSELANNVDIISSTVMMRLNQDSPKNMPRPHILTIQEYPGSYMWVGRRRPWGPCWKRYVGCSHGLLVTVADELHNIYLFEPHRCRLYVPIWDKKIPLCLATLSSPACTVPRSSSVMVITGISSPAFVIFRIGVYREKPSWIKHDCEIVDPYDHSSEGSKKPMCFTNAIGFKGKFYALSSQGTLAVIEEEDSQFRITGLGKNRAVPSGPSKHFLEYLLDSNGEILLVFLVSRKSINTIDDVEVFWLDLSRLAWTKMESLGGDRALFMGTNCCMSVAASQVGCKRNHVYFSTHRALVDGWKEYDMENGSISSCYDSNGFRMKSPKSDQIL